jgi:hypothetical protein
MKKNTLLKLLVLPMFALLLNSCKKFVDEFLNQPDLDMRFCNIDKIQITGDYPDEWNFTYNMLGNPVSIVKDEVGTGNPNWYFTYDTESRLSQAVGMYTNGNYEMWKRFKYNNKDQIIKDTTWIFGAVMGDQPDPNSWRIAESTYSYDAMGRITKIVEKHLNGSDPDIVSNYTYNAQGNLTGYTYDGKTNISRTNRVWMFLNRDYSKNNRVAAVNYNTAKLPLTYNTATPYNFLGSAINYSKITYICP